jgi:hypothetical protein
MGDNKYVCCICGREYAGWGSNPWPISEKGECCITCNFKHVVPARIALLHSTSGAEPYACDED